MAIVCRLPFHAVVAPSPVRAVPQVMLPDFFGCRPAWGSRCVLRRPRSVLARCAPKLSLASSGSFAVDVLGALLHIIACILVAVIHDLFACVCGLITIQTTNVILGFPADACR